MKKKNLLAFIVPTIFIATLAILPFSCFPSRDGGVFRSFDRGESWEQKVVISKNRTIASSNILSIAIDPKDSKVVYLGTRGEGIYKSMDGGEIWYHLDDASLALDKRANVYDIAISPQNSGHIYAGVYQNRLGRLLRSDDAGKNWEEVYRTSQEKYAVFAVEIDSYDPAIIYMGTAEGVLLKSVDFGKSWKVIRWFDDVITDIKVNPYDTRTVFVSTFSKGIFRTSDKGGIWQGLEGLKLFPRETEEMQVLLMDRNNPNVLYSGAKYGLLKSMDGGQSWQKFNIIIPPESVSVQAIALDPLTFSCLYYAAGNVVYRTRDNGQTWTVHPVNSTKNIKILTIDPQNPNIIYAGMGE